MTQPRLTVDRDGDGAVATLTFRHPPANAIDLELIGELRAALAGIGLDDGTRVLVVRSAVPRMFMAGADLKRRAGGGSPTFAFVDQLQAALLELERLPVATIAAIEGHAVGGGCELALACDFRVMARGPARFGLPEVGLGLLAAGGGGQRIARLLGVARALEVVLLGRLLDADEAAAAGLVTTACDAGAVDEAVDALTATLLTRAPLAVAAAKRAIHEGAGRPLEAGLAMEALATLRLDETEDAREGVAAFVEGRPPRFLGR